MVSIRKNVKAGRFCARARGNGCYDRSLATSLGWSFLRSSRTDPWSAMSGAGGGTLGCLLPADANVSAAECEAWLLRHVLAVCGHLCPWPVVHFHEITRNQEQDAGTVGEGIGGLRYSRRSPVACASPFRQATAPRPLRPRDRFAVRDWLADGCTRTPGRKTVIRENVQNGRFLLLEYMHIHILWP